MESLTRAPVESLTRAPEPLRNMRLIERLQELESFDSDDQETIIKMIDAMIVKRRVEGAVTPIDRQRASG